MHKSTLPITSRHYLIMLISAFAAGIFFSASASASVIFYVFMFSSILCLAVVLFVCLRFFTDKKSFHCKKILLLPLALIMFFLFGMSGIVCTENFKRDDLKAYNEKAVWLSGTVSSFPTKTSSGYSFSFAFNVFKANDRDIHPQTIIMYVPESCGKSVSEGDTIRCWVKLKTPSRNESANNSDYFTGLRGKNIFYTGSTKNINHIALEKPFYLDEAIKDAGIFIRRKITFATDCLLPENTEYAAIMKGILVGDKIGFTDNLYERFSNAGLSHLVAVSGMHLSILFSALSLLLNKMHFKRRTALVVAIPCITAFAAIAGFTPSVCRSAIMLVMMIIATLFRRNYLPLNALFLSLGIILFFVPYALFSKSLVLSFSATFAILVYFKYIFRLFNSIADIPGLQKIFSHKLVHIAFDSIASSFAVSISAFIGTAFFSGLFFGKISMIQIITNIWLLPIVTIVFCLGFCACIFFYICPNLTFAASYYPLRICLGIISKTASCFGSDSFVISVPSDALTFRFFAIYTGIAVIIFFALRLFYDIIYKPTEK